MNETIEKNWVTEFKAKLACNSDITENEYESLEAALMWEHLLSQDADIADQYTDSGSIIDSTLRFDALYERIKCGTLLTPTEHEWCEAEYLRLSIIISDAAVAAKAAYDVKENSVVLKSGIHTWNDGASTTGDIPVTGLLATDSVIVTLHSQTAAEVVLTAQAATGQINVVMDSAAANTTTKLNYAAFRAL